MQKYVAFLHAIYAQKMAPLRDMLEEMGFSNVDSFLATGNLIFETETRGRAALEAHIEEELHETLGSETPPFIRSFDEVTAVARCTPFDAQELEAKENTLRVGFLKAPPAMTHAENCSRTGPTTTRSTSTGTKCTGSAGHRRAPLGSPVR